MARLLTTKDAYALVNAIAQEALGGEALIQAVDVSSFISVGETILASGTENTLNALSLVIGRTMVAVRPYEAKLRIMNAINSGTYANRIRKISYYTRGAQATGADNTDLYTNLANGYDNGTNSGASVPSMWEQNAPIPFEMNFAGSSEWQEETTVYEHQLQVAFSSPSEFIRFVDGIMTEKGNDIEQHKEAFNRANLLNFIAGKLALNNGVIDLTEEFNNKFGTSYTSQELRTTYLVEFLEFFVSFVKRLNLELTHRSVKYHVFPSRADANEVLARHTPLNRQKMFMLSEFWLDAEAMVKTQVFNDQYLNIRNFEEVLYWQNINEPSAIDVTPAIPDFDSTSATYGTQVAGERQQVDYVLGVIFDEDAMMTDFQLDRVTTTPLEARKYYRNMFWTIRKNNICDFTENGVVLIMSDESIK